MNNHNSVGKSVSLVLGSGGARGLAHIGVIRWLERNNFSISAITGCSIGSLIGGAYAAGKLDLLEQWMLSLAKTDIASLLDFTWNSGGLFKGDKIISTLTSLLEDIHIEDLPISFTAVATDISTEKEVWLNSGSLFDAIRASISLPLFFTPVKVGNAVLIDGGVLNPVPIAPAFNDDTDTIIAVNLGGAPTTEQSHEEKSTPLNPANQNLQQKIQQFAQSFVTENKQNHTKNWSMYEIADKAFDTMQSSIARTKIASYPPDLEIVIPRNASGTFEFHRAAELIQLGYTSTEVAFTTRYRGKLT